MYQRKYVRGESKLCWCGAPRRKGGRLCLGCHAREGRTRRSHPPRSKTPKPAPHVKPRQRAARPFRVFVPKLDIRAALAPVWAQLDTILNEAEAYPLNDALGDILDAKITPMVNPLGVGYRFFWSGNMSSHEFYNLKNYSNRITIS